MLRILVVEDHPDLRETLSLLLEGDGRQIESAESAEAALRAFTGDPFDVVFTDVKLPGLSGVELAVRLHTQRPDTWIVLSSGGPVAAPADGVAARTRFLGKPFTMEALDALMAEFEAGAERER